ncbi:hypothetical protein D3C80_1268790 [compost metagenome]
MGDGALVGGAQPALGRVLIVRVQHRVGVAIPVITPVPARRRQQADAPATVGEASGHLPADVLGVGKNQVQCRRTDFAAGFEGFLDVLGARQVEQGVHAAVALEVRRLQRKAQAAIEGLGLQGMLLLAKGNVEQRAMASFIDSLADRPLAFDKEGFVTHDRGLPFAVDFVQQAVAFALDLFQVQVLVVAHDHGHAPGQFAIETRDNAGHPGKGDAGCLVFRRADLHIVPG